MRDEEAQPSPPAPDTMTVAEMDREAERLSGERCRAGGAPARRVHRWPVVKGGCHLSPLRRPRGVGGADVAVDGGGNGKRHSPVRFAPHPRTHPPARTCHDDQTTTRPRAHARARPAHPVPAAHRARPPMSGRRRRTGASRTLAHFRAIAGHRPYPWQRRLCAALVRGAVPDALDIPTGLGKTAAVLLALLARLENAALPRRIVYVVDRRAIVDQTAEVVRGWIERIGSLPALARAFDALAAHPAAHPVGLGVLRGGLADDGAWRLDPARCAVLVGTVDMVGSRLLFSGYGDGRSLRAAHAGLLGHDALVLLDEAHLSPAFSALLRTVERMRVCAQFRTMALSATGAAGARVLGLTAADLRSPEVRRRLDAVKRPRLVEAATGSERNRRIVAAAAAHRSGAVAVFVERVADARRIARALAARLTGASDRVAVLTGTLRGRERAALIDGAVWRRFVPGPERPVDAPPVWLVATAAAEVGVDLDADHAVMDLSTLDSMVQRLGRVNRAGRGEADVTVVFTAREAQAPRSPDASYRARRAAARAATLAALRPLARLSPRALRALDPETVAACSTPAPRPAPLDAAVLEVFASTSAAMPRPPVAVYLRGVSDEPPTAQCILAWRRDVAALAALGAAAAAAVLAFFPPAPAELARVPAPFARALVRCAIERSGGAPLPLVVVGRDGAVFAATVADEAALPALEFATVLLPGEAGGLSPEGLPDAEAPGPVEDVADTGARLRYVAPCPPEALPAWVEGAIELRVPFEGEGDDETGDGAEDARCLVYAKRRSDATAHAGEGNATARTLDAHAAAVAAAARRIGAALALPAGLVDALECAGRWHDAGKARAVWQRAAGAPPGGPALAKSPRGRLRPAWLGGYRHECGSLADAERALPPGVAHRDLVLHLIAAHHGWARPTFAGPHQLDPESTARANVACARRAARRFARLQAEHGPWRLAWLEALLKAADAHVSRGAGEWAR